MVVQTCPSTLWSPSTTTGTAFAQERRQFGQAIGKFGSVADKIANMKIAVDAARGLILRVGWIMDRGEDAQLEAAVDARVGAQPAARALRLITGAVVRHGHVGRG